jgi:heptosyltransferase III
VAAGRYSHLSGAPTIAANRDRAYLNMNARSQECVLIFRLGSIGDTVVALPCFYAIARAFSSHRRVLLTNALNWARASSAESVLASAGLIHETIYYPVGFSLKSAIGLNRQLRDLRPKTMIYMAERSTAASVYRDLLFFKAAGIPKIVGAPWTKELRTCRTDPNTLELEHESERLARTLKKITQVDLTPPNWDLRLSAQELTKAQGILKATMESHPLLAVAPGVKVAAKSWGTENWTQLLKSLSATYRHVALVIVGAPEERGLGTEVAQHWAGPILNLCGMLTPRETAAVLRGCRLLVCHDSGPMHLAASQQTPCVALFGNLNRPRQWYPYGSGHRVIQEPRGILEISVERVADSVRSALGVCMEPKATEMAGDGERF